MNPEQYRDLADKVLAEMNRMALPKRANRWQVEDLACALGCHFDNGATRHALIFLDRRVVIKFPYFNSVVTDYCALEVEKYKSAEHYGVQKILLPIFYMGTSDNGIPIYVQQMYSTSEDGLPWRSAQAIDRKVAKLDSGLISRIRNGCAYRPPNRWVRRATQIYGKKFMRSFERWSREQRVNDLHDENVGYLKKQPIIIDYAGYFG